MLIRTTTLALLAVFILFAAGCRTSTIQNITDAPVTTVDQKLTDKQVRDAIVLAGGTLGWQMKDTAPGHLVGTLYLRDHMAKVDIPYSANSYSILYKDSANMKHNGNNIHSNYNGWVENLDRGIRIRLLDQ